MNYIIHQYDHSDEVVKTHLNEFWLCRILKGKAEVLFEQEEYKVLTEKTGKTPKELINEFLIGQIKNALLTTEMTHQQIADQFGFPDQSAFGQFFKRQEGMSPSEWRQKFR